MTEFKDIVLAFGESDEYRCVRPNTVTYGRKNSSQSVLPVFCFIGPPLRITVGKPKY